jgi:hypothetical protein
MKKNLERAGGWKLGDLKLNGNTEERVEKTKRCGGDARLGLRVNRLPDANVCG